MKINFQFEGDFVARQKAEEFCERNFLSVGPVDGEKPRGIKIGKHSIPKWSDLSAEEIGRLDGDMRSALSDFACIVLADRADYLPGDLVCEVTRSWRESSTFDGTPLLYFEDEGQYEEILPPVFTVDTILAEHRNMLVCEERNPDGTTNDFYQYEVRPKPIKVGDRVRSTTFTEGCFFSPDERLIVVKVDGPFLCIEQGNGHVFRQHNIFSYRAVKDSK